MEIWEELNEIFARVFDEPIQLKRETSATDIEGWDSLTNIQLIVEVKKVFDIDFLMEEVIELNNVGEFYDLIERKLSGEKQTGTYKADKQIHDSVTEDDRFEGNSYRFDDLTVGMQEEFSVVVSEWMLTGFCKISGDTNPLHVDEGYAIRKGFNSKVVYGMLTSAFYSKLVGVYLPGEYCLLEECRIGFNRPVYIEDSLTVKGIVSELDSGLQRAEIDAEIRNQEGLRVSKATIIVGFLD